MRANLLVVFSTTLICTTLFSPTKAAAQTATNGWQLFWSDEFNGPANTPPDPTKWNYDIGGGGWGNGEQENYTNSIDNAFQDGSGNLVIRAIRDSSGNFTSARLRSGVAALGTNSDTANLNWQFGKVEARIKLPFGPGVWPAFWMLGADITTVPWPGCGEVDILENFGANIDNPSTVHGTIHGPNYQNTGITASYQLPNPETFTNDFHIFSVEWSQDSMQFFVDGSNYESLTPASLPSGGVWEFNNPFFILLNLAIGGNSTFLGTPTAATPFPQDMLIDYVRVYHAVTLPAATPGIAPGGIVNAASGLGTVTPGALATVYGVNLADSIDSNLFDNGAFSSATSSGVTVNVNGLDVPLIYVSPNQINFQMPWETALSPATVNVTVTRNGVVSSAEPITVSPASPSVFLNYTTGVAYTTVYPAGPITPGVTCVLYGNGFGPASTTLLDGVPAATAATTASACALTVDGQPAVVTYCGAAPGEVIDQLNFIYPSGVTVGSQPVTAALTINGVTGTFLVPPPAS
jgi:uncharacterized protein (TIGR03437 family)